MSLEMPQNDPKHQAQEQQGPTDKIKTMLIEARKISIRAIDRNGQGQLLASPEGAVSNLSEQQWKLVRTKAFKQWFGDWESPKVRSFVTAQGSIYVYSPDGKTTRFKKATNELHEKQDVTVFVDLTPEEQQKVLHAYRKEGFSTERGKVYVMEKQTDNTPKRISDISEVKDPGRLALTIVQDGKMTWAKKAEIVPKKGLLPFDTKSSIDAGGEQVTERHLGNRITDIYFDSSSLVDENGEPRALKNEDETVSFVKMLKPLDVDRAYVEDFFRKNGHEGKPERYQMLMKAIRAAGHDGLILNGRPVRFNDGSFSFDEKTQMIRV